MTPPAAATAEDDGFLSASEIAGRAETLKRAMLALIDQGMPLEAHRAFWAPFVVAGEGAAPRSSR